jgi:hypothetical protein
MTPPLRFGRLTMRKLSSMRDICRVALMIMDNAINPVIRGALSKTVENAKIFMAKIEEHFQGSSKASANILMSKMMHAMYNGMVMCESTFLK